MLTPIHPTLDDLICDVYYFAVPWRLCWDNFKKFMGENTTGAWTTGITDLEVPQITISKNASAAGTEIPTKGSLWDYFGLIKGKKGAGDHVISVSALPFRAYWEIYDYFIRNQNLIAPKNITKSDSNITYRALYSAGYALPAKMSKLPSYTTTALPEPIKGGVNGHIPMPLGISAPIKFENTNTPNFLTGTPSIYLEDGTKVTTGHPLGTNSSADMTTDGNTIFNSTGKVQFSGYADLTQATASTIQALRLSAQTEMILSRDAVFGTRYFDEILYGHYGVHSGAAKYEKPQFIGGKRIPINMNQCVQTSSTDSTSPQGNVSAFSLTADVDYIVNQSFTEHQILIGILCVRQLTHTSQQNIPRQWSIRKRLDMWWHEYDHLGPQPIYNKEIYADGTDYDDQVFGYQERYAEYRFEENVICGEFNSKYSEPLDSWHYGDVYNSLPVLSQQWIEETDVNVARTLAVQNHDQFMADITLYIKATRPLPVSGMIGGLIDHF